MEEVYVREGDAPLRRLEAAYAEQQQQLESAPSSALSASSAAVAASPDPSEAIQAALKGVVWTRSMRRLYTLLDRCLQHQEPVLLVGETGTGKTTVCQVCEGHRGEVLW